MGYKVWIRLHGFCHLLGDFVDERVKGQLYVDVVLGACLDVLYSEGTSQVLSALLGDGSDISEVTLIADEHYSGILPREVSDCRGPVGMGVCECVCVCASIKIIMKAGIV